MLEKNTCFSKYRELGGSVQDGAYSCLRYSVFVLEVSDDTRGSRLLSPLTNNQGIRISALNLLSSSFRKL